MIAMPIVWIAPAIPRGGGKLRALRAAGFIPVAAESVEDALHLLRQFRAVVVVHASKDRGWQDCARLLATGSPVAVLVDPIRPEVTQRYLNAGCAAVIDARCPPDQLITALMHVARVSRSRRTAARGDTQ